MIPKEQYGGGTVKVWDEGEWVPRGDAKQGLKDGELKVELRGKKLKGNWALVRMHGRAAKSGKTNWLLIKERDKFAREDPALAVTDEKPASAVSGRTMEQVAASKSHVWNSTRASANNSGAVTVANKGNASLIAAPARKTTTVAAADLKRAPREKFPGFIAPQRAQQPASAPGGVGWVHELKLDGYRIQILIRSEDRKGAKS